MTIKKIVFDNGMEIQNISSQASSQIIPLMFKTPVGSPPKMERLPRAEKPQPRRKGFRARRWTQTEDDTLRMNYGKVKATILAKSLNRSTPAVHVRITKLGLRNPQPTSFFH